MDPAEMALDQLLPNAFELTLNSNTAHTHLSLSEENRKVECVEEEQSYPDHPERFIHWEQVLCRESLTGRCYWETEWSGESLGKVDIAVAYESIGRQGDGNDCRFGWNEKSWSMSCTDFVYTVCHSNVRTDVPPPTPNSKRVGVYVDCDAGTLSFYSISIDPHTLSHLHTFNTTFTEPLYAGFWVNEGSSVSLIQI